MPIDTRLSIPSHVSLLRQTMDDISSLESLFEDEDHFHELYQLAVHGGTTELKSRLDELPNPMEYLTTLRLFGNEHLSLLMVAALHGRDDIARLFLAYDPSDEQVKVRGAILNEDQTIIQGVNALYCACYRGHFHLAKTLIEVGKANPDDDSLDLPYNPLLLHATMNNRLDIVRFLVENRYADVNETKSNGFCPFTALMCAARYGHVSLAQYFIDSGADVNHCSESSFTDALTALVIATEEDRLEVFVLLRHRGATMDHSLLEEAVRNKSYSIVRFLLDESLITPDQLELEAASPFSWPLLAAAMHRQVEFLRISLEYRQRTAQRKVCPPALEMYDYHQECQTVDELEAIANDRHRISIEFLLIQDRLQSSEHHYRRMELLEEYSDVLVDKKRFDTCLDLCHHIFDVSEQEEDGPSLHLFIWLVCRMLSSGHRLPIDRFLQAANLIFRPSYQKDVERSVNNALFMVILSTKIFEQSERTTDDHRSIVKWVQNLCRMNLRMPTGQTLLHLCVDEKTNKYINYRSVKNKTYIKFPNEACLRLLLTYGSRWLDVNAMDSQGYTPLHTACREEASPAMIELLVHHGSHLDSVDAHGKIPISYTADINAIKILTPRSKVDQLKCLCARLTARHDLKSSLMELLPAKLKKFVFLHDARRP